MIISLFPTYDQDPLELFSFSDYSFYYKRSGVDVFLSQKSDRIGISQEIVLDDDEFGEWSPEEALNISRKISVKNASRLYYSADVSSDNDYAIACQDAIIGLGVLWSSADSNQRGAIVAGEIRRTTEEQSFSVQLDFPKGSLKGELHLKTVLFLLSPGSPQNNEFIYANTPGVKLGELDSFIIQIDGNGSFFPIRDDNKPGEPLWWVECNWADPETDLLADCVTIVINKAHKNYPLLDRSNDKFNKQLLLEVLSSAVEIIVETLREEDEGFTTLQKAQEGSVSLAVRYFRDNLGWDITTPSRTSLSIRKHLEKNIINND